MKTKLAQFISSLNTIDHRQIEAVYFVLILAVSVILRAPYDGGGGPI